MGEDGCLWDYKVTCCMGGMCWNEIYKYLDGNDTLFNHMCLKRSVVDASMQ